MKDCFDIISIQEEEKEGGKEKDTDKESDLVSSILENEKAKKEKEEKVGMKYFI